MTTDIDLENARAVTAAHATAIRISKSLYPLWLHALTKLDTAAANRRRQDIEDLLAAAMDSTESAIANLSGQAREDLRALMAAHIDRFDLTADG